MKIALQIISWFSISLAVLFFIGLMYDPSDGLATIFVAGLFLTQGVLSLLHIRETS